MSTVRDILQFALHGKGSVVARHIVLAERTEAAVGNRFGVSARSGRLKHLRWLFDVYARDWSQRRRSDAWRVIVAVLNATGKTNLLSVASRVSRPVVGIPVLDPHRPDPSIDRPARLEISEHLGHHRVEVVAAYIGGRR
jgi:hypothetical protein